MLLYITHNSNFMTRISFCIQTQALSFYLFKIYKTRQRHSSKGFLFIKLFRSVPIRSRHVNSPHTNKQTNEQTNKSLGKTNKYTLFLRASNIFLRLWCSSLFKRVHLSVYPKVVILISSKSLSPNCSYFRKKQHQQNN